MDSDLHAFRGFRRDHSVDAGGWRPRTGVGRRRVRTPYLSPKTARDTASLLPNISRLPPCPTS